MSLIPTPSLNIVDLVLWFLGFLSLITWTIIIAKFVTFTLSKGNNQKFIKSFRNISHLGELKQLLVSSKGSLSRVCQTGLDEVQAIQTTAPGASADDKYKMLMHGLRQSAHEEQTRMESGLGFLASIGSTAPFIGLFGTVWGIMHALKDITKAGSAGLDIVAGPIGEALIATAIGIAVAVPAVLAYNYFLRRTKLSAADMDNFASAFQYLVIKSSAGRK